MIYSAAKLRVLNFSRRISKTLRLIVPAVVFGVLVLFFVIAIFLYLCYGIGHAVNFIGAQDLITRSQAIISGMDYLGAALFVAFLAYVSFTSIRDLSKWLTKTWGESLLGIKLGRHKLVRDNIPNIIRAEGLTVDSYCLSEEQFEIALRNKAIEEVLELVNAKKVDDIVEELSDVHEVLEALQKCHNISDTELRLFRELKATKKGVFKLRQAIPFK